jgi:type II secretory pathway pseudopilin PulG
MVARLSLKSREETMIMIARRAKIFEHACVICVSCRPRQQVAPEVLDLERRFSELQSQIDRLTMALHLWRENQDHLQPLESRLAQLTDRCSEIVDHWEETGERQAQAIGQLEQRMTALNAAEAAAGVTALSGFDRAEARLVGLETSLHRRLAELSDQVQSALTEFRSVYGRPPSTPGAATSWPLDGVVRLHNQLRQSGAATEPAHQTVRAEARPQLPEPPNAASERMETIERTLAEGRTEIRRAAERTNRTGRLAWGAVVLIALVTGLAGVLFGSLQRQVGAARRETETVTQTANEQIAAARQEAAQQIAEARATALTAQTISNVLAAPDLIRFSLVGTNSPARAQISWSRTRGFVVSGSRLPVPSPGSTYQVWFLTPAAAVSAGTFVPNPTGTFSLATDALPRVPRPIGGASVTIEPSAGSEFPTGPVVLARLQ